MQTPKRNDRPGLLSLASAGFTLIMASAAIRLLPLKWLLNRGPSRTRAIAADSAQIVKLSRALAAWSRRLPWRTLCLEQGLAANWILRAAGRESTLHYGAATRAGELAAHVWVTSGELPVVGCENSDHFVVLSRKSNASSSSSIHGPLYTMGGEER